MLQDLVGRKAKIIGFSNTEEYFGFDDEDMSDLLGETGTIDDVIGCILDDKGEILHSHHDPGYERNKKDRSILGVEMFDFNWHIDDIELVPIKERKTKKTKQTFKFDPTNIMLEEKKSANKPSRNRSISRLSSTKRKSTTGNRTSKRSNKGNSKRTSKVRK